MRSAQQIQNWKNSGGQKQPVQCQKIAGQGSRMLQYNQSIQNQFREAGQGRIFIKNDHFQSYETTNQSNGPKNLKIKLNQAPLIIQRDQIQNQRSSQNTQSNTNPSRPSNPKSQKRKKDVQILCDYMINCKIIEAQLSKDFSTFLNPMNVFCEVKFSTSSFKTEEGQLDGKSNIKTSKWMNELNVTTKNTQPQTGQNPKWNEGFTFNYQKISKSGLRILKASNQNDNLQNKQQMDFTLYKKIMLFPSEKIGETTIHLHDASSGCYEQTWVVLNNEKDEVVGKLLIFIEIKKDNTQKQLRKIQQDLQMQEQQLKINNADPKKPGMTKDMTEDKGMPLRNHEQVHLLNERSEPQSNQQSNAPSNPQTNPQTQNTQVTHVTHQTQSSALALWGTGGTGGALQGQGKSSQQSISVGGGPGGITGGTAAQQNRITQNSIMGATNITIESNPAVGSCSQIGPLYLETTNIIPNNKVMKQHLDGGMMGVLNNQTVNNGDEEEDDSDDEDEDDDFQDDDEISGSNASQIEDEGNNEDDEINSAEEDEPSNTRDHQKRALQRPNIMLNSNAQNHQIQDQKHNEMMSKMNMKFGQNNKPKMKQQNGINMGIGGMNDSVRHYSQVSAADDHDNSGMLLGMGIAGMSVVATQHIREEYDEEEQDDYGGEFEIGMVEETPPVVEGGGPSSSTGVQNTNKNDSVQETAGLQSQASHVNNTEQNQAQYRANLAPNSQGGGRHQAINRTNLNNLNNVQAQQNGFDEDEDDESNISPDEQDEQYVETGHQNQYIQDLDNRAINQSNQIIKQNMMIGRNQKNQYMSDPQGSQNRIYQQYQNNSRNSNLQNQMSDQIQHSLSAISGINSSQERQQLSQQKVHYQSQKIGPINREGLAQRLNQSQSKGSKVSGQQARTANQSRSIQRPRGNVGPMIMQRNHTQQNFKTAQAINQVSMVPAPIPRCPQNNNGMGNYASKIQGNQLQEQQININTIDVEPSFRQRQNKFAESNQNQIVRKPVFQQHSKDKLVIKRGKFAVSGTPVVISQGQIQQSQLQIQPQRTNSVMRSQNKGPQPFSGGNVSNKQQQQYQRGATGQFTNKTNPINSNLNTQLNQHSIFSQQTSFFNTNMANSQIQTQEAQQNTQTNHTNNTNDLEELNIGEIDNEDLLQNQNDSSEENQAPYDDEHEEQVNSEGDIDHYPRNPPKNPTQNQKQNYQPIHESPIHPQRIRSDYNDNQASGLSAFNNQQDSLAFSGQSDSRASKKNKRKQPSQEPIIVNNGQNANNLQNAYDLANGNQFNNQRNLRAQDRFNQQLETENNIDTNHQQTGSNAVGSNQLEQETFSMQQDTFQVDPNHQQTNTNGVIHTQCQSNMEINHGNFAHHGPVFDSTDGIAGQNQLNFNNSVDQTNANQDSSLDISYIQQRKFIKKSKKHQINEFKIQRDPNSNNIQISEQIPIAVQQQNNRPHTTQNVYSKVKKDLSTQSIQKYKPKQQQQQNQPQDINNIFSYNNGPSTSVNTTNLNVSTVQQNMMQNIDHSVIQHITSHSHSTDGYGQINAPNAEMIQLMAPAPAGVSQPSNKNGVGVVNNQHMLNQQRNKYEIKKQSDSIQIGGGTVIGGNGDEDFEINHDHPKIKSNHIVNQPFLQQFNSYQEDKDSIGNPLQSLPAAFSGSNLDNHRNSVKIQNYVRQHTNKKIRNNTHESSGTNNTGNTGMDSLDQNMFSNNVDLFSQLNNRALNHEHQLNEMHKNLTGQFQRIKKEKTELREMRLKIKEETKKLKQKQIDINQRTQQLQKQSLNMKREKLLMNNEAQKIQVLYNQFTSLINKQQEEHGQYIIPIEIGEKLNSIKVLLELVINDRQIGSKTSLRAPQSQDIGDGITSLDNNLSLSDDKQDQQTTSTVKKIDRESRVPNSNNQTNSQNQDQQSEGSSDLYQKQLQQICNMYQNKLHEMTKAWESMQNLHIMNNQMNDRMNQMNHFQSQMQQQFQNFMVQKQQLQQIYQPSDQITNMGPLNMQNTSINQLINPNTVQQPTNNQSANHLLLQNPSIIGNGQLIQGSPLDHNIQQQPQLPSYPQPPFSTTATVPTSMQPATSNQILATHSQSFDSQNDGLNHLQKNIPQYGQSSSRPPTTNVVTPPVGHGTQNQSINLSQVFVQPQQTISQSNQHQSLQAPANEIVQILEQNHESQDQRNQSRQQVPQLPQLTEDKHSQHMPLTIQDHELSLNRQIELQLSPVENIQTDATNITNATNLSMNQYKIESSNMNQPTETSPQITIQNQQVNQIPPALPAEEEKHEQLAQDHVSHHSSTSSEFKPDPNFLDKINANIRKNNEIMISVPQCGPSRMPTTQPNNFRNGLGFNRYDPSQDGSNQRNLGYHQSNLMPNSPEPKAMQQLVDSVSDYGDDFPLEDPPDPRDAIGNNYAYQQHQNNDDQQMQPQREPMDEQQSLEDNSLSLAQDRRIQNQRGGRALRNGSAEETKEQSQNNIQGAQGDFTPSAQLSNNPNTSGNQSITQPNLSGYQSQSASSQMPVLQSIQQKLQKIGPQTKLISPATNHSDSQNIGQNGRTDPGEIEIEIIDSSRHIAPPTVDKIKPRQSDMNSGDIIVRKEVRDSTSQRSQRANGMEILSSFLTDQKQRTNIGNDLSSAPVKNIEDDELLRLVKETQQADDDDWPLSTSGDTDTFNQSPNKKTRKAKQKDPIVYGKQGQIYDEPNRAVYGIKKAKGGF